MAAGRIRRPGQRESGRLLNGAASQAALQQTNGTRLIDTSARESPHQHGLAGENLAGGYSGGGIFLRAAASGLSRPGADQRAGPLVSRFGNEAALDSLADVQRRCVGAI